MNVMKDNIKYREREREREKGLYVSPATIKASPCPLVQIFALLSALRDTESVSEALYFSE